MIVMHFVSQICLVVNAAYRGYCAPLLKPKLTLNQAVVFKFK